MDPVDLFFFSFLATRTRYVEPMASIYADLQGYT